EELHAIEQIKKLKARYFRCMDTKDWDGFENVFAPDATMDTTQEAPQYGVVQGSANIRQYVEGMVGPVLTVHHGHMPEIEIRSPTVASPTASKRCSPRTPVSRRRRTVSSARGPLRSPRWRWAPRATSCT